MAKKYFEQWLWELAAAENLQLSLESTMLFFVEDCKNKFQTLPFSGVLACHQNVLAEWSIQTIMCMVWTLTLHVSLH